MPAEDINPSSEPSAEEELDQSGSEDSQESLPGEAAEEQTFYNPAEVPEALRPTFLEMKKSHTQAHQKLAATQKQLDADRKSMQADLYKAKVLDTLLADQRVLNLLEQIRTGESPEETTFAEESESIDPTFEKLLTSKVGPLRKELEEIRESQRLERERVAFIQQREEEERALNPENPHPFNAAEWLEDMRAIWEKNPGLDMETTFRVVRDQRTQQALRAAKKKSAAGRSSVEAASGTSPVRRASRPVNSIRDAAEAAIEQLGLSRREIFPD